MLGTGLGHLIPLVAYLGFWVMILLSLGGKPLWGLYYLLPFIPYRSLRDKFLVYPLGANVLTILVIAIIIGAILKGKRLPKSGLWLTWFIFGVYLYFSLWVGTAASGAPPPLWLQDINFVTWKDYMMMPLVFVAAGLVVDDRKAIRRVIMIVAVSVLLVDRSAILETLSRSWAVFDENKRTAGPLVYGSNQLAAFLAQFAMFFWGFGRVIKRKKWKLLSYAVCGITAFATMYTFSRGAYAALLVSLAVLAILKDRKLLILLPIFFFTWQKVVPAPVTERVQMTTNTFGQLDESSEERVKLWEAAKTSFYQSPILGNGYATFQLNSHIDNLHDTHNWYIKVLVETGVLGGIIALVLLLQMITTSYALFRTTRDPLYTGLGLGCLLAIVSCLVANCFGDRWTYLEINGLLWVLLAAAIRARQLVVQETSLEMAIAETPLRLAPSMEWQ